MVEDNTDSEQVDLLKKRITELQKAQDKLSKELWRLKRRRTLPAGLVLVVISAVAAVGAFFINNLAIEIAAVIAFFIGFFLIYSELEKKVPVSISAASIHSSILPLQMFLTDAKATKNGIYIPAGNDLEGSKVFVAFESSKNPEPLSLDKFSVKGIKIPKEGFLLLPTGQVLYSIFSDKLGLEYRKYDLEELMDRLSNILSEDVGIVSEARIWKDKERIHLVMNKLKFSDLCRELTPQPNSFCRIMGCPICSAIALVLSKATDSYIVMEKADYDARSDVTNVVFNIGKRVAA